MNTVPMVRNVVLSDSLPVQPSAGNSLRTFGGYFGRFEVAGYYYLVCLGASPPESCLDSPKIPSSPTLLL